MKRSRKGTALLLVALILLLVAPGAALAVTTVGEERYTLPAGRQVDDDLLIASDQVVIDGEVNGDLFVVGSELVVNGRVNGDILAVVQNFRLNGEAFDVRVLSRNIDIGGKVNGNLNTLGDIVVLGPEAEVEWNWLNASRSLAVAGSVRRDLWASARMIDLAGSVGRDAAFTVDNLIVRPEAAVEGNLSYTSERRAEIPAEARLGSVTYQPAPVEEVRREGRPVYTFMDFLQTLGFLAVGFLTVLLFPSLVEAFRREARKRTWWGLGLGFLTLVAAPVALILVAITVVGFPLAALAGMGYAAGIYLGQALLALTLGNWLLERLGMNLKTRLWGLLLGTVLLTVLVRLPYVGFAGALVSIAWAFGLFLLAVAALWQAGQSRREGAGGAGEAAGNPEPGTNLS